MRYLKLAVFLLTFSLEVRVQAKQHLTLPNAKEVVQIPADCINQINKKQALGEAPGNCALSTVYGEKFVLQLKNYKIALDENTVVVIVGANSLKLVNGQVWVRANEDYTVASEFGEMIGVGDFWVHKDDKDMLGMATGGDVLIKSKSLAQPLRLAMFEENWISGVDKEGKSITGIPRVIQFTEHIERWARLYDESKEAFIKEVALFKDGVEQAISVKSIESKRLALDYVARQKSDEEKHQLVQQVVREQNRQLLSIFRDKNNLN